MTDHVWYATPARARSRTKWIVYDDVGTLSVENDGRFSFRGRAVQLEGRVESADLTRQRLNLVSYLIAIAAAFPVYFAMAYGLKVVFGLPLLPTLLVLYSVVLIGLLAGFATRWVRVHYTSSSGERGEAYFADGGAQGWRGIFGGTRKLFEDLQRAR